jgi:hypothetical protein
LQLDVPLGVVMTFDSVDGSPLVVLSPGLLALYQNWKCFRGRAVLLVFEGKFGANRVVSFGVEAEHVERFGEDQNFYELSNLHY